VAEASPRRYGRVVCEASTALLVDCPMLSADEALKRIGQLYATDMAHRVRAW
jgi:hypothetical protein